MGAGPLNPKKFKPGDRVRWVARAAAALRGQQRGVVKGKKDVGVRKPRPMWTVVRWEGGEEDMPCRTELLEFDSDAH